MASNERADITQQNFENFMQETSNDQHFGFKTDDFLVISNNHDLCLSLHKTALQIFPESEIKTFGDDYFREENTNLNSKWANSIYFQQELYIKPFTHEELGGSKVIIFTVNTQKLNDFTQEFIRFHVRTCKIDMDMDHYPELKMHKFLNMSVPKVFICLTVDNRFSNVKISNGIIAHPSEEYCFDCKGMLGFAKSIIDETIADITKPQNSTVD